MENNKYDVMYNGESVHIPRDKQCYCIGPSQCNDTKCRLVKEFNNNRESQQDYFGIR